MWTGQSSRWGIVWATLIVMLAWARTGLCAQPPGGIRVLAHIQPSVARPGTVIELAITIELAPGWVTYDFNQAPDSVLPTRIRMKRSRRYIGLDSFIAPPALERPEPFFNHRIVRFFQTSPTFRRPVLVSADAGNGNLELSGHVDLQVSEQATHRHIVLRKLPFRASVEVRGAVPAIRQPPLSNVSRTFNGDTSVVGPLTAKKSVGTRVLGDTTSLSKLDEDAPAVSNRSAETTASTQRRQDKDYPDNKVRERKFKDLSDLGVINLDATGFERTFDSELSAPKENNGIGWIWLLGLLLAGFAGYVFYRLLRFAHSAL